MVRTGIPERLLWGLMLLGFLVGLWGVAIRHKAEQSLEKTEILLDSQALSDWQLDWKGEQPLPEKLLQAGVSSLAFGEMHLDELVERGVATPMSYQEFELALDGGGLVSGRSPLFVQAKLFNQGVWKAQKPGCFLLFSDTSMAFDVARTLGITLGEPGPNGEFVSDVELLLEGRVLFVPMTVRQLRLRSLGFDLQNIQAWSQQGFQTWIRPENSPGLSREQLKELFALWKQELPQVQGVIFGGPLNEAIGYPDELETTAEQLTNLGWKLGYIELPPRAQQSGIEFLVRALPGSTVRVMAVSPAHQQKLSPFRVLGMYSLGARERNLRVLYVRPFAVPGRPELDDEFIFSLADEVKIGPAATFGEGSPAPHLLVTTGMALGAGALCLLLLQALGVSSTAAWALALLCLPVFAGVGASLIGKSVLFRSLLALCVSIGGPTLAFLRLVYPTLVTPSARGPAKEGLRLLVLTSLASLLTGLWVAALLPDTTFLLGLDRFRGVKLLTLGTPLLVALAFLWKRYTRSQWLEAMMSSLKLYQAALIGVVLAAFGILLLRTGNEAGATASDSERYLRVVLDQVLGVRPRFKEFLLAHPAMLCTPLVAWKIGFLPSLLMVVVAAIGQAGIVDTFAHVHTPLMVTLIRVVLGVGFGALFGLVAHALLCKGVEKVTKAFPRLNEVVK